MALTTPEQKHYHKFRHIYMVDADVARLSAEIVATFPTARFVDYGYWRGWSGTDPRQPWIGGIPRCPALTDTRNHCPLQVWLEPEGWVPEWAPPDEEGNRLLLNEPTLLLLWHPPSLGSGSWSSHAGRNRLHHAEVLARYRPGDHEHIRLIEKAWRLLKRVAVNNVDWCQSRPEMETILGPFRSNFLWIGHEALEWLREDPERVIWHGHRPCDAIDRPPDLNPWQEACDQ